MVSKFPMRVIFAASGLISIFLLSGGCANHKQSARITSSIDDKAKMFAEISHHVPVGTPLTAAQRFMENEGFACEMLTADESSKPSGGPCLYCDRSDQIDTWVSRRWQISLEIEGDCISNVEVNEGLVGL